MIPIIYLLAVILVVIVLAALFVQAGNSQIRKSTIPGPKPRNKHEGNLVDIRAIGSLHQFLLNLHGNFGPIASFHYGAQMVVSISSPDLYKKYLKTFDRPPVLFEFPMISKHSLLLTNGQDAHIRREAYLHTFSDVAIKQQYPMLQGIASESVHAMQLKAQDTHIPFMKNMFDYSIKCILRGAFGKYFDDENEAQNIRTLYDECSSAMDHMRKCADDVTKRNFYKSKGAMYDFMQRVLKHHRSNSPGGQERRFIEALDNLNVNDEIKVEDMVTILFTGFHTTALLLTWCLYYLAKHQEVQDRLLEEIERVLGNEEVVNVDNVDKLTFLRQVMNESVRCSVLGAVAGRVQAVNVEVRGHQIPAHTPVVMAIGVTHVNEEFYPAPERFDPGRFTEENVKSRPSLSFNPFGFVKGRCLGYKFSNAEFYVFITTLLPCLKVELVPGQVVTPLYRVVTTPADEVWVTLSPRY